jgi:hypothetical protein
VTTGTSRIAPTTSVTAANILRFNGIHNVSDGRHRIAFGGISAILAMRVMY